MNFDPVLHSLHGSHNSLEAYIFGTLFVGVRTNLAVLGVWPFRTYSYISLVWGFRNAATCILHQSFTEALVLFYLAKFLVRVEFFDKIRPDTITTTNRQSRQYNIEPENSGRGLTVIAASVHARLC